MPAPTIYYIRHGETDWNADGRLQGTQDIALNARGRAQAARAGAILADLFARRHCDRTQLAFVSSPLGRARATMELLRDALGLPRGDYTVDDRLREIGFGTWEGSTLAEMQAADPQFFARREAAKWTLAPAGGESYAAVQQRMADWYRGLTRDTVAVAHGGTARALTVALGLETPEGASEMPVAQGVVYLFGSGELRKYD